MAVITSSGAETLLQRSSLLAIPHDPASVVVYVLLGAAAFAIWYGDRRSRKRAKERAAGPSDSDGFGGEGEA